MKKFAIVFVVLLLIVFGALFFLISNVNTLIRQGIETAGPEILQAPVQVATIDISLLSGSGVITGLKVGNPKGYQGENAMVIDRILVELDPLSVLSDKVHFREIVLDAPAIFYAGDLADSNLQQLQRNAAAMTAESGIEEGTSTVAGGAEVQNLQIDQLSLNDVKVEVALSFLEDKPLSLTLPSLTVEDIGKDEDTSMADAVQQVLKVVNKSLLPLIRDNTSDFSSQFQEQKEKLKEKANESIEKLKSLFK